MGQQIEKLARFAAETRLEDIPAPVQRHAKMVLLDTLGVILAGAERPEVRDLRERLAPSGGTGATVYAGTSGLAGGRRTRGRQRPRDARRFHHWL
jgi:2-methylcitrate dehydratase PrpD